jgi:hypothetical protein
VERWAANTLSTLGIIFTAGIVLLGSLFLLLLSMCSFSGGFEGGRHPDQGYGYLIAAMVLVIGGIFAIVKLARGIKAESLPPGTTAGPLNPSAPQTSAANQLPRHLSPLSRTAINNLLYALIAQLVLSLLHWIANQFHIFIRPNIFFGYPHPILASLPPFVLYHIPYLLLIYLLLKRPDRRVFTFALALPAVSLLHTLFSLGLVYRFYMHTPIALTLFLLPFLLDIVVLIFAYKAIHQIGLYPEPASLVVAGVVTFIYLSFVQAMTPLLYRFLQT